jgi:hypothetical protein
LIIAISVGVNEEHVLRRSASTARVLPQEGQGIPVNSLKMQGVHVPSVTQSTTSHTTPATPTPMMPA